MTSDLERLARAAGEVGIGPDTANDVAVGPGWDAEEYWRVVVRAILREAREPSEEMVHRLCGCIRVMANETPCKKCPAKIEVENYGLGQQLCYGMAKEAWQATIDHILGESEGP